MNNETIQDRLRLFLADKKLTVKDFENKCNLSNSTAARLTSKTRRKTIASISNAFPDLNTDWLLYGEGEMLKAAGLTQSVVGNNNVGNNTYKADNAGTTAALLRIIEQQQQTIARLTDIIAKKEPPALTS